MPSVRYYNQTAPFWDFIASMEEQGSSHPFFAGGNNNNNNIDNTTPDNNQRRSNPWMEGWAGFPFGPVQHRGRHGPRHGHHNAGPPPPPPEHEDATTTPNEKEYDPEEGSSDARGPPPPFSQESADQHHEGGRHHEGGHHYESGRRQEGGRHHEVGPQHEGGHHHGFGSQRGRCGGRGRGVWGGRGRGGPFGFQNAGPMGGFGGLAEIFQSQLFGQENSSKEGGNTEDFKPDVDVFDTADSFVIHVSLPGAKKEDVSVSWDAESSQINIAGVVHRPGDEELLKTLALDERKVGAFERKVRLGSRANPAQVDADGIGAKLEDGVLRIDVPKLDSGYVEVKKVDIE